MGTMSTVNVSSSNYRAALFLLGDAFEASHGRRFSSTLMFIPGARIEPAQTVKVLETSTHAVGDLAIQYGY